jgi:hypothetical protein
MLKKTMTFKDLDGNDVTEDFYFNLNKAELAEMELSQKGGLAKHLEELIASDDGGTIIATFKKILVSSIGKRSEDGRRFIKNQQIIDEFMQTNAYPDFFMELATNAESAAEFIRGIVPAEAAEAMANGQPITDLKLPEGQQEMPAWYTEGRVPTEAELVGASPQLLMEAFRRKSAIAPQ